MCNALYSTVRCDSINLYLAVICNPIAFCVLLVVDLDQIRISKKRCQRFCFADIHGGDFQSDNEEKSAEKGMFSLVLQDILL